MTLDYLLILLSDAGVPFCHYSAPEDGNRMMSLEDFRKAVIFAMKENLALHLIYPDFEIPPAYEETVEGMKCIRICSSEKVLPNADYVVFRSLGDFSGYSEWNSDITYVLRLNRGDFHGFEKTVSAVIGQLHRLNLVLTDLQDYTERDLSDYDELVLAPISRILLEYTREGTFPEVNVLSDRIGADSMLNCNAGSTHLTVASDGSFYICPAFYYEGGQPVGNLADGPDIKNQRLFDIQNAPICRHCDAYQCRRCVWLNKKMTLEVNTPSHQQCVASHLERKRSRWILESIPEDVPHIAPDTIPELGTLDPFDNYKSW